MKRKVTVSLAIALATNLALANNTHKHGKGKHIVEDKVVVEMKDLMANKVVGTITISATRYGLVFTPDLKGVKPGIAGFHIHTNPSCEAEKKDGKVVLGLASGGHWDPKKTNMHEGPWGKGHLGDLPALTITQDGKATLPVLAPRLKSLKYIKGHSLVIHANGDNYSDKPTPLGGSGSRMLCGVIK